jgi:hypothetical protein
MNKLIAVLAIVLIASFAFAQQSPSGQGASSLNGGVVENWSSVAAGAGPNNLGGPGLGRHDLLNANTGQPLGCETCHLPHTAPTYGKAFLWAWKTLPTSVTTYVTDTNPNSNLVTVTDRTQASSRSMLCLTCHDSASANANGITGGVLVNGGPYPLLTTVGGVGDIGTQHPVNALVPTGLDYQIVSPVGNITQSTNEATATIGPDALPLWGSDYRVQCTSCHDQHNDYTSDNGTMGGVPFLRVANTDGVALCRECHNK